MRWISEQFVDGKRSEGPGRSRDLDVVPDIARVARIERARNRQIKSRLFEFFNRVQPGQVLRTSRTKIIWEGKVLWLVVCFHIGCTCLAPFQNYLKSRNRSRPRPVRSVPNHRNA